MRGDKTMNLLRGRRKSPQIKGETSDQGVGIGFPVDLEISLLDRPIEKSIHRMVGFSDRHLRLDGLFESPVFLILGSLVDPASHQLDLVR